MRLKRITAIFLICSAIGLSGVILNQPPVITTTSGPATPQSEVKRGGKACFQLVGQKDWTCT